MADQSRIEHVSDTALWVAVYRAKETERPDALFKDPFAAILIGERGRKIAASMPYKKIMAWVMAIRTTAIDRLVLQAIEMGADTVINLGTGLDTRPYRMSLPPELNWIEVDFPHIIELKNEKLRGEKPVCHLRRIALDLSQREDAQALYRELAAQTKKALVITEGVIPYLTHEQAQALAEDLHACPSFAYWVQDFYEPRFIQRTRAIWGRHLRSAPFRFTADDWFGFFGKLGWKAKCKITASDEAHRVKRRPPFVFPLSLTFFMMSKERRRQFKESRGYALLERV